MTYNINKQVTKMEPLEGLDIVPFNTSSVSFLKYVTYLRYVYSIVFSLCIALMIVFLLIYYIRKNVKYIMTAAKSSRKDSEQLSSGNIEEV